ncbi:TPA: hypothetical protein KKL10_003135 [Escherichia coli]|uniref:hypothetical protein n=1 Tax=Escherichia coli TaxID=562 RepID=UPI001C1D93F9|nr:hypothetical protein [Escherichia coli]HBD5471719.1 hypothetical protein [Escherichia coli]
MQEHARSAKPTRKVKATPQWQGKSAVWLVEIITAYILSDNVHHQVEFDDCLAM